jgi:hypothetical protein
VVLANKSRPWCEINHFDKIPCTHARNRTCYGKRVKKNVILSVNKALISQQFKF